jgi:hypothetical protein
MLKEILERLTRTESRIVQLGDHVGANLRTKQRIDIEHGANAVGNPTAFIRIDALDVSLSRIVTTLRQCDRALPPSIPVFYNGKLVATVFRPDTW